MNRLKKIAALAEEIAGMMALTPASDDSHRRRERDVQARAREIGRHVALELAAQEKEKSDADTSEGDAGAEGRAASGRRRKSTSTRVSSDAGRRAGARSSGR